MLDYFANCTVNGNTLCTKTKNGDQEGSDGTEASWHIYYLQNIHQLSFAALNEIGKITQRSKLCSKDNCVYVQPYYVLG